MKNRRKKRVGFKRMVSVRVCVIAALVAVIIMIITIVWWCSAEAEKKPSGYSGQRGRTEIQ